MVESFNRVAKDYIEINKYIWIDTVTIVCTTQEKKEFIDKKISPICHTA